MGAKPQLLNERELIETSLDTHYRKLALYARIYEELCDEYRMRSRSEQEASCPNPQNYFKSSTVSGTKIALRLAKMRERSE